MEKYKQERQLQGATEQTTHITISDEEQPQEGATKDTDVPRQTGDGEEKMVATEGEKIADIEKPEEQPPKEAGETTNATMVVDHPVNTEDGGDPGAEAE